MGGKTVRAWERPQKSHSLVVQLPGRLSVKPWLIMKTRTWTWVSQAQVSALQPLRSLRSPPQWRLFSHMVNNTLWWTGIFWKKSHFVEKFGISSCPLCTRSLQFTCVALLLRYRCCLRKPCVGEALPRAALGSAFLQLHFPWEATMLRSNHFPNIYPQKLAPVSSRQQRAGLLRPVAPFHVVFCAAADKCSSFTPSCNGTIHPPSLFIIFTGKGLWM